MTMIEQGVTFVLVDLREAPYCSGASIDGALAGCASLD
jgi:hypothetical protein